MEIKLQIIPVLGARLEQTEGVIAQGHFGNIGN